MITQKGQFLIRHKEEDLDFINSFDFENKYNVVKDFYGFEHNFYVRICFVYSKEEFVFFSGKNKIEDWNSARAIPPMKQIIIFSPEALEKLTIHKKEEWEGTLVHELSHIFYSLMNFPRIALFNEGIATYIQNKIIRGKEFEGRLDEPLSLFMESSKEIYKKSFLFINKILKNKSKEDLISFLNFSKAKSKEDFLMLFGKEFGSIFPKIIELKGGNK